MTLSINEITQGNSVPNLVDTAYDEFLLLLFYVRALLMLIRIREHSTA